MKKNIQSVRGMNDYLPTITLLWQKIESTLKKILYNYGFNEIRTPIIEKTILFHRAIGEITDVVEKEMYIFNDRNNESLALRPENTAGCVRAAIEHGLLNKEQRLWYLGPMFRYDRPQKCRYRQFHQLGVEVFGLSGFYIEAELILMISRWWYSLGITKYVRLELNSIGSIESRIKYREDLLKFFEYNKNKLDEESKNRIYKNPLRMLDSKNKNIQNLLIDAPKIFDYIDDDSKIYFTSLCSLLDNFGIKYDINHKLVRGLDYYNHTVFEWVTESCGLKNTICAGGRYDNLVKQLGGIDTPAVGFAMGMERTIMLVQETNHEFILSSSEFDIYLASFNTENNKQETLIIAEQVRDAFPNLRLIVYHGSGNFKKQLSEANKYGAKVVLILGKNEIENNQITIKNLYTSTQETISRQSMILYIKKLLN
ncbi:Histidine--tRNA ligase [Candidatus Providencia siddallii]|uniref:Histidine--tRNA ligase n=1 Tax=Candidatus Providencia siddallii TaxID=1715285 RepID=A0A0M6W6Q3_9GAMM|nr:Histidine--tRNA ligase [Candidatus Providencia siddallii]